jgi:arabinogalactan oligomer/maltooligosaccharide transport system substrate-binding protein
MPAERPWYKPNPIVVILILTVVLTIAGYLSRRRPTHPGSTLTLWHAYLGLEQKALERLVRRFNHRHPNIRVRLLQLSFDNLPQKLTNAIPRGHGPDLFIFSHDRLGDWTGKDLLEPIGYWITPETAARFLPDMLTPFRADGALYALPLSYKSVALFYNKNAVHRPPKTTAELFQLGRRLTDRSAGRFGLVYPATDTYYHAPWLHGFGGHFIDPDPCKPEPTIRTRQGVAALHFARKLAGPQGIVPPEVTGQLVTTLFKSGRAAMAISGPWFLSALGGANRGLVRFGITPLPKISATGQPAAPLLSVEGIFMSAHCRHKNAAFKVIQALTADRSSAYRLRQARQLPANTAVDRRLHTIDPLLTAFREQRKTAVLTPATPMMRMIWRPYQKALAAVISRGKDAKAALEEARWEIHKTLGACLTAKMQKCKPKREARP